MLLKIRSKASLNLQKAFILKIKVLKYRKDFMQSFILILIVIIIPMAHILKFHYNVQFFMLNLKYLI